MRPFCIASKVGNMGVGGEGPGYSSGDPGDKKFGDMRILEGGATAKWEGMGARTDGGGGGGDGEESSGEESLLGVTERGTGDWGLNFPLKSLEPLERERDLERRLRAVVDGSGVPGFCSGVGSGLASDDDSAREWGRGASG